MEERFEDLVHEGVRQFHAKPCQQGEDDRPFPDDDVFPVPEKGVEGKPGEKGGDDHKAHVHNHFRVAELDSCHLGEDHDELVAGEHPGVAQDLQADADGRHQDGEEAEGHLSGIGFQRHVPQDPDPGVTQVPEHEGGQELQQVIHVPELPAHRHLGADEHQMHHPGECAHGNGAPPEVQDGRGTGGRSRAQVGFQGDRYAESDEDEPQSGYQIADYDILAHKILQIKNTKMRNNA